MTEITFGVASLALVLGLAANFLSWTRFREIKRMIENKNTLIFNKTLDGNRYLIRNEEGFYLTSNWQLTGLKEYIHYFTKEELVDLENFLKDNSMLYFDMDNMGYNTEEFRNVILIVTDLLGQQPEFKLNSFVRPSDHLFITPFN